MVTETRLTERDLVSALADVLDRVRHGERFVVERDGERLAVLSAPEPDTPPGILGSELAARIGDLRMPGDGFADDIEAGRSGLLPAKAPAWPD